MKDHINPDHYQRDGIECIEAIAGAVQDLKGDEAYHTGAAIKYLWRWREKHPEDPARDLKKAVWYIQAMIDALEEQELLAPKTHPSLASTQEEDAAFQAMTEKAQRDDG